MASSSLLLIGDEIGKVSRLIVFFNSLQILKSALTLPFVALTVLSVALHRSKVGYQHAFSSIFLLKNIGARYK